MNELFDFIKAFVLNNFWGDNWFVGWASLASIVGLIYTLAKDFLFKRIGRPHFLLRTKRLISEKSSEIEGLEIKYNNSVVTQLSSTIVYIWNCGNEVIRKSDIPSRNPFKIKVRDEYNILSAEIIKVNKETNNFSLVKNNEENELKVDFEYIGKNQGVAIMIIHTGDSSDDVILSGETMQGAKLEYQQPYSINPKETKIIHDRSFPYVLLIFASVMLLMALFYDYIDSYIYFESKKMDRIAMIILSILIGGMGVYTLRRDIPKSLEIN